MDEKLEYYAALGVERNASEEDIRSAYKRLSVRFHEVSLRNSSYCLQFTLVWTSSVGQVY